MLFTVGVGSSDFRAPPSDAATQTCGLDLELSSFLLELSVALTNSPLARSVSSPVAYLSPLRPRLSFEVALSTKGLLPPGVDVSTSVDGLDLSADAATEYDPPVPSPVSSQEDPSGFVSTIADYLSSDASTSPVECTVRDITSWFQFS